jgi:hypothetical protein
MTVLKALRLLVMLFHVFFNPRLNISAICPTDHRPHEGDFVQSGNPYRRSLPCIHGPHSGITSRPASPPVRHHLPPAGVHILAFESRGSLRFRRRVEGEEPSGSWNFRPKLRVPLTRLQGLQIIDAPEKRHGHGTILHTNDQHFAAAGESPRRRDRLLSEDGSKISHRFGSALRWKLFGLRGDCLLCIEMRPPLAHRFQLQVSS